MHPQNKRRDRYKNYEVENLIVQLNRVLELYGEPPHDPDYGYLRESAERRRGRGRRNYKHRRGRGAKNHVHFEGEDRGPHHHAHTYERGRGRNRFKGKRGRGRDSSNRGGCGRFDANDSSQGRGRGVNRRGYRGGYRGRGNRGGPRGAAYSDIKSDQQKIMDGQDAAVNAANLEHIFVQTEDNNEEALKHEDKSEREELDNKKEELNVDKQGLNEERSKEDRKTKCWFFCCFPCYNKRNFFCVPRQGRSQRGDMGV